MTTKRLIENLNDSLKNLFRFIHIILVTLMILLFGCKSRENRIAEFIDGVYTLNKIEYEGKDITSNVIVAILSFDGESSKFKPPIINDKIVKSEIYNWRLLETPSDIKMEFETDNEIFEDVFNITFMIDNERHQIYLYMESNTTYISSTRVFIGEDFEEVKRNLVLLN